MTLDTVVRCRFLGHAQIEIAHTLVTPEAERLFALLAVLASEAGTARHRDDLAVLLWSDQPEERAKHNLRQTLYKARQLGVQVVTTGDEVVLPASGAWCDWQQPDTPVHGEWLGAYTGSFSDPFASWVVSTRVVVHASLRPRLVASMQAARASGDLRLAEQHATQLLRFDPLNEEATLVLAECAAMAGSKVDAMRLLDEYITEVGDGREIVEAVLPAKVLRTRIAERLPVSTYASGEVHDLPLVGRESELQQLLAALFDIRGGRGGVTWVWGPEGIGKSRLVHEVLKAAAMQGVRVARVAGTGERGAGWAGFVALLERLVGMPGALGTSPEALGVVRGVIDAHAKSKEPPALSSSHIAELLSSIGEENPLAVILDSCDNWSHDALSLLLDSIEESSSREIGAVLTCRRTLASADIRRLTLPVRQVRIDRLNRDELKTLLEHRLQLKGLSHHAHKASASADAADGNPLFAIELLGKALNPADGDKLPFRVKSSLAIRIRRLDQTVLEVLVALWLHGDRTSIDYLCTACGSTESTVAKAIDALLAEHLARGSGTGFAPSDLLSYLSNELVAALDEKSVLTRCAEALRERQATNHGDALLFRAALALCLSDQREKAAQWIAEDLGQLVASAQAPEIVAGARFLEGTVGLDGPMSIVRRIRDEVMIRAKTDQDASPPQRTGPDTHSILPATLPEELRFNDYSARLDEYLSSLGKAGDSTFLPTERVRAACHAIVIGDNLRRTDLVTKALATVEAIAIGNETRPIDVARARLIAQCSLGNRDAALSMARELAGAARKTFDIADSCRALRNAAQASLSYGQLDDATAYCGEALGLALRMGYAAQAARCQHNLAMVAFARGDIEQTQSFLDQALATARAEEVSYDDIAFDCAAGLALVAAWHGDLQALSKQMRLISRGADRTESPLVIRETKALELLASRRSNSEFDSVTAHDLAASLGNHRPDEIEDRIAFVLLRAAKGLDCEEQITEAVGEYQKKKETLGYPGSPLLKPPV